MAPTSPYSNCLLTSMLEYAIFPNTMLLKQAHQEFVNYLKEKDRANATILAYGKDIEQLLDHVADLKRDRVDKIVKEDIDSFLNNLEKESYTKKSISRKINSIKTFFRFLKINNYVINDPAMLITHPKFETKPPRILDETEYRALRDAARSDTRTYAIIELLLQTGVRIGELAELTIHNVKIDEEKRRGELIISESRATRGRTIPLNKSVITALLVYMEERPKSSSDALFITRTSKPLLVRNIRSSIDRYFKKAGVEEAKVNDLRHTWIAHHIKRGVSLLLVSKLAGHKRLATTEKYLQHVETKEPKERTELTEL